MRAGRGRAGGLVRVRLHLAALGLQVDGRAAADEDLADVRGDAEARAPVFPTADGVVIEPETVIFLPTAQSSSCRSDPVFAVYLPRQT